MSTNRRKPGSVRKASGLRTRRRRWFEAADFRHATLGPPVRVGDKVRTLCGKKVVMAKSTPGRYAPECPNCGEANTFHCVTKIFQQDQ